MNIEEQLKRYRENQNIIPDEQHIKETVRKSIESYCSVEQIGRASCRERV